jgi:hypothetical protein
MEYYLGYCDKMTAKELEETDIVMFAGKFILKQKDIVEKQKGMQEVNSKLQKILDGMKKGAHEYKIFLKAELGDYDVMHDGFKCDFLNRFSCIDLLPGNESADGGDEASSVIERGLLFGKVSRIKLFFINTDEFKILKYPADKIKSFMKPRTDAVGKINKDIYIVINAAILSKDMDRGNYDKVAKDIYVPGMENNYFMIGLIKAIEVYSDLDLKNKLGEVGALDAPSQPPTPPKTLQIDNNL